MASRTTATMSKANSNTPYALSLLLEYAHLLDASPLDLSRSFADLRELDAVLSSSMASLRQKATRLIEIVEQKSAPNDEKLWLLAEIAEEAMRLKLGGDDKIRVASQATDNLHSHYLHMSTIASHVPGPEPFLQQRQTKYPHVAAQMPMLHPMHESGRRRRAANAGGLLVTATAEMTTSKRKRLAADHGADYAPGAGKSPWKDRAAAADAYYPNAARPARNGQRAKKVVKNGAQADSLTYALSNAGGIESTHSGAHHHAHGNSATTHRHTQAQHSNRHLLNSDTVATTLSEVQDYEVGRNGDIHDVAPSSSLNHPSLMEVEDSKHTTHSHTRGVSSRSHANAKGQGAGNGTSGNAWTKRNNALADLEGPGMSTAVASSRALTHSTLSAADRYAAANDGALSETVGEGIATVMSNGTDGDLDGAVAGTGGADAEADDGRVYCICEGVSYGEMIGCDDPNCEREWFHIACIGLADLPKGEWFCDSCRGRRATASRRAARGGKKRAGAAGGRAGGRSSRVTAEA